MTFERSWQATGWFFVLVVMVVAASTGCGSTRSSGVRSSGFLGDLSGLQELGAAAGGQVYVRELEILGTYDKFILEPALIVFEAGSSATAVEPQELARLTGSLREKVANELRAGGYEVVEASGPDVLRIRAALTNVDPSGPAANVAGKVAGIVTGVGGFVVPAIDLGGAAIEAEMLDSVTGERVAAFLDARKGRRFGGTLAAVRPWGHAEDAFEEWANGLRGRLDELHGKE